MSDNIIRFRSILKSLTKLYPKKTKRNFSRHIATLAAIISGIIASKSCQLPQIATKIADARKTESRIKAFYRWLKNKRITTDSYFLPYARLLVLCLMHQPLVIIFDGSAVGHNCISLVASVVYKKRALPLCWITTQGIKGHLPEARHIELVNVLVKVIPQSATVIFLGDGEFDGSQLLKIIKRNQWHFVCRTGKNRILYENGESFSFHHISIARDNYFQIPNVRFDDSQLLFDAIIWWNQKYKEPIYLITTIELAPEAMYWYQKRFRIETMFSDKKSRGFHIHKSHIADPERINRLLIATSLAYIFIVYFGVYAIIKGFDHKIHRTERCDLSFTQMGFRLLDHLLNLRKPIPIIRQLELFNEL